MEALEVRIPIGTSRGEPPRPVGSRARFWIYSDGLVVYVGEPRAIVLHDLDFLARLLHTPRDVVDAWVRDRSRPIDTDVRPCRDCRRMVPELGEHACPAKKRGG